MPKEQLKERSGETDGKGGDVSEKSSNNIDFAGGSRLEGESHDFPLDLIDPADGRLKSLDVYLPPERLDQIPRSQADPYEYESAGGAEFPRERLEDDFATRVSERYTLDRPGGEAVHLSLTEGPGGMNDDPRA